jgi:hypothetical protein
MGQAEMGDPGKSGASRDWRLIVAALLALGLVIGGIAYKYADELSNLAQSVTGGKTGHAQGHFHY